MTKGQQTRVFKAKKVWSTHEWNILDICICEETAKQSRKKIEGTTRVSSCFLIIFLFQLRLGEFLLVS